MSNLRTFLELDRADQIATFEAMALLLYARLLIANVPPRRWRSRFGVVAAQPGDAAPMNQLATIRRMRLAIARALRNVPGAPNCLPQALAGRWMLQRRGIASSLFLGTQRDDQGVAHFHAWLKVGDEWVTGLCDENRYALFSALEAETA